MSLRAPLAACVVLAAAGALAAPPPRYLPAPAGKFYYLLYGNASALGAYTSSETSRIPAWDGGNHDYTSEWKSTSMEVGTTLGYGLGKLWFLRAVDVSAYIPFTFRSFDLASYFVKEPGNDKQLAYAGAFLHPSVRDGQDGKGLGDVTLSTLMLLYTNPGAGAWLSTALRVTLPTGASAQEQFARILHGEVTGTGSGGGTTRFSPVLSFIKTIAGQRAYVSAEYSLPLAEERFGFTAPDTAFAPAVPFWDANDKFEERITHGAVAAGTLGLETTLSFWGIVPALEVNVRQSQAATWKEGVNGAAPADATAAPTGSSPYPVHTTEFLRAGAWAVAGLPLKSNTEVEVGLLLAKRFGAGDQLRFGASYISSTFGNSLGLKVAFVSLFLEKPQSDRAVPGRAEAREVEVAPVLEAPLAPASRIGTGVSFPLMGKGISQEEAAWTAGQVRAAVKKLRGYDLFPEKDMEQLAYTPCGDAECGTRYGRALKLPAMVVSRLEKSGAGFALGVQMINVADGTVAASDAASAATLEELKGQIPALLEQLVRPPAPAAPAGK